MIETSTECQTTATSNKGQLIVFTQSKKIAKLLTQKLCSDNVVAKQYGSVKGYWGYRTADSFEFVGKGIADMGSLEAAINSAIVPLARHSAARVAVLV